jgi:hypothetical protein
VQDLNDLLITANAKYLIINHLHPGLTKLELWGR